LARSASSFQSPVQGGDFRTGAATSSWSTLSAGFSDLSGRRLGEPDGLIGFGARLVERAAQLLEPALEQQVRSEPPKGPCFTIVKCVSSRTGAPATA